MWDLREELMIQDTNHEEANREDCSNPRHDPFQDKLNILCRVPETLVEANYSLTLESVIPWIIFHWRNSILLSNLGPRVEHDSSEWIQHGKDQPNINHLQVTSLGQAWGYPNKTIRKWFCLLYEVSFNMTYNVVSTNRTVRFTCMTMSKKSSAKKTIDWLKKFPARSSWLLHLPDNEEHEGWQELGKNVPNQRSLHEHLHQDSLISISDVVLLAIFNLLEDKQWQVIGS